MPGRNLYVCGISDRVSTRELEDEFSRFGRVSSVDLKVGFAFVEFEDEEDAADALHKMNGKDLDGRSLRIEYGRSRGGGGAGSGYRGVRSDDRGRGGGGGGGGGGSGGGSTEKIYVGGLPMETREDDIEDLFGKYGRLVDVVLRTNLQRPPAFAFLTYENSRDAEDAVEGRNDYMFNSCRLRVEFSKADGSRGGGGGGYGRDRSRSRGRRSPSRSRDRRRRSPSRSRDRRRRSPSRCRRRSRTRSRSNITVRSGSRSRSRSRSRSPDKKEKKEKKERKEKKEKKEDKGDKDDSRSRSRSATPEKKKKKSKKESRSPSRSRSRS